MKRGLVRLVRLVLAGAVIVALAGCAASVNTLASQSSDVGFWYGLWHGFITPVTFIVSLFSDSVGIYEVRNVGGWYDFGFMIGVSFVFGSVLGGSGAARSARSGARSAT
jgi:hypothetical protein